MADARDRAIAATAAAYLAALRAGLSSAPFLRRRLRWLTEQRAEVVNRRVVVTQGRVPELDEAPLFGAVAALPVEADGATEAAALLSLAVALEAYFRERGEAAILALEPDARAAEWMGMGG